MENLFDKWKTREPKFDIAFRELLFDKFTRKGGREARRIGTPGTTRELILR